MVSLKKKKKDHDGNTTFQHLHIVLAWFSLNITFKPIEGISTVEEALWYLVSRAAASHHQADHKYHRLSQF
jgi:hypothetical protein